MRHGVEGYGIYFMILERLREEPDYSSIKDYNTLAFDFRVSADKVKSVVEDFGLFSFTENGERFYSESFTKRMTMKDATTKKLKEAGKKGAKKRWGASNSPPEEPDYSSIKDYDTLAFDFRDGYPNSHPNSLPIEKNRVCIASKVKESKEKGRKDSPPTPPGGVEGASAIVERFDLFWEVYPRKEAKPVAKKAFFKLKPSQKLTERMIRAVAVWKRSDQWQRDNGQYIPYPATWLNQERWNDEPTKSQSSNKTKPPSDANERAKQKIREYRERSHGSENRNDGE